MRRGAGGSAALGYIVPVTLYTLVLFLRMTGAIAVFVGLGTLMFGLAALRRSTRTEDVRAIIRPIVAGRRIGLEWISVLDALVVLGMVLVIGTGLYMALTIWSLQVGWIAVAIASVLVIGPIGPFLVNPRLHRIGRLAEDAPDGPLSAELEARTHDRVLAAALQTLVAALVGIVFVMTNKPALLEAVVAMTLALAIGLVSALPIANAHRSAG